MKNYIYCYLKFYFNLKHNFKPKKSKKFNIKFQKIYITFKTKN